MDQLSKKNVGIKKIGTRDQLSIKNVSEDRKKRQKKRKILEKNFDL
jgi:hypothetical protein